MTQFESEDKNGYPYQGLNNEEIAPDQAFALTDELDHEILMYRDAHFGGDFKVMFDYYQGENLGINPHFDLKRIAHLANLEKQMGQDLAPLILSGTEAEKVARARRAYEKFKEIYAYENKKNSFPHLIADLILSEEEIPDQEIEAITAQGVSILEELFRIVNSDDTYDPLFPGYGFAPYRAIICLGKIGDPSAIIPLFETFEKDIVFDDFVILEAFAAIGESAKEFLLKIIKSHPLTKDNVHAAFALTVFSDDPEVAIASFEQLQDPETRQKTLFRSYLLCNCEKLQATPYQDAFIQMAQDPSLPRELRAEIKNIVRDWH